MWVIAASRRLILDIRPEATVADTRQRQVRAGDILILIKLVIAFVYKLLYVLYSLIQVVMYQCIWNP